MMNVFKSECPICGNIFSKESSLSRHIESTHKGKTYQCQHCEQKYTNIGSLKTHIQSIHEGKTFQYILHFY